MKRTIQLLDLPLDRNVFDADLPAHVEFRAAFFDARMPNALLIKPGQPTQPMIVPVVVVEFDPDAEVVPHRFAVCASGAALDARHNELRYCATLIHPEGKAFVLFEVVGHLGACVHCRRPPNSLHGAKCPWYVQPDDLSFVNEADCQATAVSERFDTSEVES